MRTRGCAVGRLGGRVVRSRSGLRLGCGLAAGLFVGGCASAPTVAPENPVVAAAGDADLTVTRAGYVDLMLGNIVKTSRSAGEGGVFAVVADYGGGYVTTASVTGAGGTPGELLTFDTVIGATGVTDRMQGETDFGPSAIGCFRFTIGYYGNVSHSGIPCPAGISPSTAAAEAQRQAAAAQTARALSIFVKGEPLPLDLASALQDGIGVPASVGGLGDARPSATASAAPLVANDFDAEDGVAALSVPQPDGACVYLRLTEASATSGSPGGVSVYGWAAPTRDPCTGQAALSEGGYVSADPYAGG